MTDNKSIVIFGGLGLGDNLVQMVLGENARRAGYAVTMLSTIMSELSCWFPEHTFRPSIAPEEFERVLNKYDRVLWAHETFYPISQELKDRWVAYEKFFQSRYNRVENMALAAGEIFGIEQPVFDNGIVIPEGLKWRNNEKRVVIHPTSAEINKNWLPSRFLKLAGRLAEAGFEVVFIMSVPERPAWEPVISDLFPLIGFDTLDDCAKYMYESGYFIGNDSGGGHLASNLNIPVLSIHGRKSKAGDWQPGWGHVEVVSPRLNLIGSRLRQQYWKYFLSVSAVEKSFHNLRKQFESDQA